MWREPKKIERDWENERDERLVIVRRKYMYIQVTPGISSVVYAYTTRKPCITSTVLCFVILYCSVFF